MSFFPPDLLICFRSLSQLSQQKPSSQWSANSSTQFSPHDFDIFLQPSKPHVSSTFTSGPPPQPTSYDPFFDSKFSSPSPPAPPSHPFDPFGSSPHSQSDPFGPSFPSSAPANPTSVSFDPFGTAAPSSPPPSQSDLDFGFLSQSSQAPQVVQKQFSIGTSPLPFPPSVSSLSLPVSLVADETFDPVGPSSLLSFSSPPAPQDWSTPSTPPAATAPPLATTTSGDVDDALQKLRDAYGLSQNTHLDENFDGSNHGELPDDDWPMSPRPAEGRVPAPVIGKPHPGRYSHSGASHSPYPIDERTVVTAEDLNLPSEGMILARLSVR
jgi:hypothetical protein